jgi:hypothetical protein
LKGQYLLVELLLTLHESEELYNASHCKSHAMGVLSVCNIESRGAAFHFAGESLEVYLHVAVK